MKKRPNSQVVYLIYLDESGDTGVRLDKPHAPKFGLVAALIHESRWVELERELISLSLDIRETLGLEETPRLHAWEMYQRRGAFAAVTDDQRYSWIERALRAMHDARPIYHARILDKADQLAYLADSPVASQQDAATQGKASYDPYVGYFGHLLIDLQAILERENELGIVFVDQHDRTRQLPRLNIYRAWRFVGIVDRLLEAPVQLDGRQHSMLAIPDFVGYIYLAANRDKGRDRPRPYLAEWSQRYILPNVATYKPDAIDVERLLAQGHFLMNWDEPSADLAQTIAMVRVGFETLRRGNR